MLSSLGTEGTTNRTDFMNHLMDVHTQAEKTRQLSLHHILRFLWLPMAYPTASVISHRAANATL